MPAEFGCPVIDSRREIYPSIDVFLPIAPDIFVARFDEVLFKELNRVYVGLFHSHAQNGKNRAFQLLAAIAADDARICPVCQDQFRMQVPVGAAEDELQLAAADPDLVRGRFRTGPGIDEPIAGYRGDGTVLLDADPGMDS